MSYPEELQRLQRQYDEVVEAYESGALPYEDAAAAVARICVTDGTGAVWSYNLNGELLRAMPGETGVPTDESQFVPASASFASPPTFPPFAANVYTPDEAPGYTPAGTDTPDWQSHDWAESPPMQVTRARSLKRPALPGFLAQYRKPLAAVAICLAILAVLLLVRMVQSRVVAEAEQAPAPQASATATPSPQPSSSDPAPSAKPSKKPGVLQVIVLDLTSGDAQRAARRIATPGGEALQQLQAVALAAFAPGNPVELHLAKGKGRTVVVSFVAGGKTLTSVNVKTSGSGSDLKLAAWPALPS